jgi:hypothetical protein
MDEHESMSGIMKGHKNGIRASEVLNYNERDYHFLNLIVNASFLNKPAGVVPFGARTLENQRKDGVAKSH